MPSPLPSVEVVRKSADESFDPHTPVLTLRWADCGPASERLWELPEGLSILGSPPRRFGLHLRRHSADGYAVRLVWGQAQLSWPALSRMELLGSSLASLMKALGQDLWSMLEQPVGAARAKPRAA
jgi:hypothetical protein